MIERARNEAEQRLIVKLGDAVERGREALRQGNGNMLTYYELEMLVEAAGERYAELKAHP